MEFNNATNRVKNIKKSGIFTDSYYIGRKSSQFQQSVLANPFILENESKRKIVVQAYREWLWGILNGQYLQFKIRNKYNLKIDSRWICPKKEEVIKELDYIHKNKITLYCWCSPKLCHGHIIIKAENYIYNYYNSPQEVYRQ